jgi:hypothetical protein
MIEDGYYWVQFVSTDREWEPAMLINGDWYIIGNEEFQDHPANVGPKLDPPT